MIPELTEPQLAELPSAAETKLYRAFRDWLPPDFVVFSQVTWIVRTEDEHARDGESDFVFGTPSRGFLCIEVKGGGIGFDSASGEWYSIERNGDTHAIKDPNRQALGAKFSIIGKLSESQRWRDLCIRKVVCGHSVFLPDLASARNVSRPDLPVELIGCAAALLEPRRWIEGAFDYWHS